MTQIQKNFIIHNKCKKQQQTNKTKQNKQQQQQEQKPNFRVIELHEKGTNSFVVPVGCAAIASMTGCPKVIHA